MNEKSPNQSTSNHKSQSKSLKIDDLECGDGVPNLQVLTTNAPEDKQFPGFTAPSQTITAFQFAIGGTLIGQLLIALAILGGGSALIGAAAAIILLICGLSIVLTGAINSSQNSSTPQIHSAQTHSAQTHSAQIHSAQIHSAQGHSFNLGTD